MYKTIAAFIICLALTTAVAVAQTPTAKPPAPPAPSAAPAPAKKDDAKPADKKAEQKPAAAKPQTVSSGGGHILLGGQLGVCKLVDSPWHSGGVDQSTVGLVGDVMVGYSFGPSLSVRADIGLGLLGTKAAAFEPIDASQFSTTVIPVSVDVLYRIMKKPAFSPYLIGSVGIMPWSQGLDADTLQDAFSGDLKTNMVFGGGIGLQYAFNQRMSAFLEGRYHYFGQKAATNGALDTNNAIVRGSVGVAMNLFSRGQEKPALAVVKGRITDKSMKGLDASVTVGSFTARTSPATGDFQIANVPVVAAPYQMLVEAAGFLAKTSTVQVTRQNVKTPAVKNLTLDPVPVKPGTVAGSVLDYKTGAPLAARLVLNGPKTQTIAVDAKGLFALSLDPGKYDILAKADGYHDKTAAFTIKDGEAQKLSIGLIKKKEVFAFENITFDVGKATIRLESEPVLSQLLKVLQDNPEINVEIAGHTDKVGSPKNNLVLSQARAAAVVKWLMDKGVRNDRMVSRGYGDSKPVADNKTKAGRAKNRRIEIAVLESVAPPPPTRPEDLKAPVMPAPAKPDTAKKK